MLSGIGCTGPLFALADWIRSRSGATSAPAESGMAVDASSDTEATIVIRTKEGDTVSISLDTETDATYAFYRRTGTEGAVRAAALTTSTHNEVSVAVQGDLSQEEISDISHLLRRLGRAIRSLLRGHPSAALRRATAGGHADSLAGFSLDVERSNTLTVVQATAGVADPATQITRPATAAPLGPAVPSTALQG
ncbi:MAG TPA: hypothetical protein VMS88_07585 [Terriglobales bacterium]|nr:hypothetical protein [Terriglobales bacterium]